MRALVVLPSPPRDRAELDRVLRAIGYLPDAFGAVELGARTEEAERWARALEAHPVVRYVPGRSERSYDAVVFMPGSEVRDAQRLARERRVYHATEWGQLVRVGQLDEHDYPHFATHAFNRLGPRVGQFRFFPHVLTELRTGLGPINEFGYRITVDLPALADRPKDHIVIAVFGGSSTWSTFSQHDDMFTAVLERMLEREGRFTILNFGLAAASTLSEMLSYILFCERVRPEIVIAHDGFNDLALGQHTDPYLLNRFDMTYYDKLERWAQILHGSDDEPFTWPWTGGPTPVGDHPRAIIGAFIRRRRQFAEVVRAHGGIFVAGLQPLLTSKAAPSAFEAAWPSRHDVGVLFPIFANVPYLYHRLLEADVRDDGMVFADIHTHFGRYGADVTLFEDLVHTRPAGDRAIAEFYHAFLRERVMPELLSGPR